MSNPVRQLRPRVPVNYQVDEDSEVDDGDEVDNNPDDDPRALVKRIKKPRKQPIEQPFEFFALPQEMRDMVYREALVDPYGIYLSVGLRGGVWDRVSHVASDGISHIRLKRLSLNLLATCKTVYYEALPVAYRQPFIFCNSQVVHAFLVNLQPSTIGVLKDITITRMRDNFVSNNNALLSGLRHAINLTDFRLGGRVTGSEFQFAKSTRRIGMEIASRFFQDTSYFVRSFVASHGIDALLQVVKFQEADLQGRAATLQGGQLTQARKDTIMESVKAHLLHLLRGRRSGQRR